VSGCKTLPGLVCLPFLIVAQDQSPAKIRTDTNAVQVDVSVRDGKGAPVPNLTRDDFKISDEGKPRPIQIFSYNKVAPVEPPPSYPRDAVLMQTLPLAEGASRLSIIVRDSATGRIGSLNIPLATPPK
jgi:VWFA-related protein